MALFDVWIDVQRRWVYLEGIFTGSADINHLLPVATQRFQRYSCGGSGAGGAEEPSAKADPLPLLL